MGEVISVLSGKGGTGKTTLCALIATCMAAEGKKVLCIDADVGLRNLDIALGMASLPVVAFTDVLDGHYTLADAALHPRLSDLSLFTAPLREEPIDPERFGRMLRQAREEFDYCLIDAPAGLGPMFRLASRNADRCLLISTPDPASLRDAARTADILSLDGKTEVRLIINRVSPRMFSRMELTVDDVMDSVGLPLLGLVPEDHNVMLAAAEDEALIFAADRGAAEAGLRIARRLCGRPMPLMKL